MSEIGNGPVIRELRKMRNVLSTMNVKEKRPWLKRIEWATLLVLTLTLATNGYQIWVLRSDYDLKQRPFVGLSEITPIILSGKTKPAELDVKDEMLLIVKFVNQAPSPAKVQEIKLRIFYGAFLRDNKTSKVKRFFISDLLQNKSATLNLDEKGNLPIQIEAIPIKNKVIFNEVILLPNHSMSYRLMVSAKKLMDNLFDYDKTRPVPVFVESQIRYLDLAEKIHYHNSIHQLYWMPALNIQIVTTVIRSNDVNRPLHITNKDLFAIADDIQRRTDSKKSVK